MERFVRIIIGAGMSLVGGLWLVALFDAGALLSLLGGGLVLVGIGGLVWGIWDGLDQP